MTGSHVFSNVIIWVTLGRSEKISEKWRVGVLSRVTWPKLGQNQEKSLIFTIISVSQNHVFELKARLEGPRNMKFGQVIAFNNTKNL